MEENSRNLKSLWDMVEAFGGLPGKQKGLISRLLKSPGRVRDPDNVTAKEFVSDSPVEERIGSQNVIKSNIQKLGMLQ